MTDGRSRVDRGRGSLVSRWEWGKTTIVWSFPTVFLDDSFPLLREFSSFVVFLRSTVVVSFSGCLYTLVIERRGIYLLSHRRDIQGGRPPGTYLTRRRVSPGRTRPGRPTVPTRPVLQWGEVRR